LAGIQLIAEIEPKNSGSFALLDDKYMRGGLRVVETYDELDSIPSDRLKDGCLVMVTTPSKVLYVYNSTTETWDPFSTGGGGGGSDWLCVEDGETTKLVKDVDTWTQKVVVINHIRTYSDYFALPTEYVQNNEVAYCKADVMEGTITYKKGLYYYDLTASSWVAVNTSIEIDSALSETSKRPVQNRVITKALEEKVSKDDVDNVISRFSENPIQNKAVAEALENIKPGKTMTAEEYEALDDETKNDDSFYYISDTGEIYQNGIIYGGKQVFDVTQEEYDALTDEEKSNNEYHCTDTGRTYINGILYGDKKPIELTYEEYKQLEADGLVEPDVDYIIIGNESGVLLTSTDVAYDSTKTVKGKFDEVDTVIDTLNDKVGTLVNDEDTPSTDTVWSSQKTSNELATKQENMSVRKVYARRNSSANKYILLATIDMSKITYIGQPLRIKGVIGNMASDITNIDLVINARNGFVKKILSGTVTHKNFLTNDANIIITKSDDEKTAYVYLYCISIYGYIDAEIYLGSVHYSVPSTFDLVETMQGTEYTNLLDTNYVVIENVINDTSTGVAVSTWSSSKINTELNKKLHTYTKQWYGSHDRYVKLGSIPISTGTVSVGSLLVTLFASSTKVEEYPVGTINLNISSGAATKAFNINGFSTIALNIPRADNSNTPRIVVDKTSTHYVLYIDCSYNYLKITCSILNSTNFTFGDFEVVSALEGTEVWSSVTSDDIKYLGSLKTNSDTNLTTITFDETKAIATSGGHGCTYMVRNGICYVNMDARIKTNGQICTLPKPVQTVVNIPMTVFMHNLTGEVDAVNNGVLIIRSDGTVTTLGALTNESRYMMNFSYPIM